MAKVIIVGAGPIGTALAYYLTTFDEVESVRVIDTSALRLRQLHDRVPNSRVKSFQADVRDPVVLQEAVREASVVIGCTAPALSVGLATTCVAMGVSYCDLGGNEAVTESLLMLGEEAKAKGVTIVPNCGLAPGLTNIITQIAIAELDSVKNVRIRVGDIPRYPSEEINFRLSWSPEKVLEDYTSLAMAIVDGEVTALDPLTDVESISFGDGYGALEAFVASGSQMFLARALAGKVKNLDYKIIRRAGHASQMRFVIGMGLAEKQLVDARSHVTFYDALVRRMKRYLSGDHEDIVLMRIEVEGKAAGSSRQSTFELEEPYDVEAGFSAMQRCVALPTTLLAVGLADGTLRKPGVIMPEALVDKGSFCDQLASVGLHIRRTQH